MTLKDLFEIRRWTFWIAALAVVVVVHHAIQSTSRPPSLLDDGTLQQVAQIATDESASDDAAVVVAKQLWETTIQELEKRDAAEQYPDDAILLLGSSSIRLWKNAAEDLSPYAVIPRGYGGARFSDLSVFAERLITPHRFQAVILFAANDVVGGKRDATPEQVEEWVRSILREIRDHQPDASTILVEITPTPSRWKVWPAIRKINETLREIAFTEPNVYFVSTAEHYLDSNDQPIATYFVADRLHQNEQGYALWSSLIRRRLEEVLGRELVGAVTEP